MPRIIAKDVHLKKFKGTLPRTEKASKKKSATGPKEEVIQEYAEGLCDVLGLKWIHIPNAAYRSKGASALKGVPDLLVFKPCGEYNLCLLLELKRKNLTYRQSQRNWKRLNNVKVRLADTKEDVKQELYEFKNTETGN